MVGLLTEYDDLLVVAALVIFAPFFLVFGIGLILVRLDASPWITILVTLANIAVVAFFMNKWNVIDTLKETMNNYT